MSIKSNELEAEIRAVSASLDRISVQRQYLQRREHDLLEHREKLWAIREELEECE